MTSNITPAAAASARAAIDRFSSRRLATTRSDADCSVGYYGVGIENALEEAGNISRPLMLHIAEQDQFCPPEAQSKITAAMGDVSSATVHSYADVDHAFARIGGAHYDQAAADQANGRTASFFTENLG